MPSTPQVALIFNANKTYDRKIIRGIARYVQRVGPWSLYVEDEPLNKMPDLRHWQGDGIIADLDDDQVVQALRGLALPVVGVGGAEPGARRKLVQGYVHTDNARIAAVAADHLLERGLRHFAYCGIPRTTYNPWSMQRGEVFAQRLRAAGFTCATYTGRHRTTQRWDRLQAGLVGWIESLPKPVGIMACNDARARHVLEAARRLNLQVPDDVAVIGVDNDELMCELANPPLTSVIQGTEQIGREAARLLDRLMRGETPGPRWPVIEPTGIATRRSTDLVAVEDDVVARAALYVRRTLGNCTVDEVCRHAGVSRTTLDLRFRKACGRTAHDQIRLARLDHAKRLLSATDLPTRTIARRAGYSSVQYLSAIFRRELGLTPAAYRKRTRVL